MQDLQNKVAVITGAASGIGLAFAQRFASAGMKLVLADIEEAALSSAEQFLADAGAEVVSVLTDVSVEDQVHRLADETFRSFGTAHVVCNNAGGGPGERTVVSGEARRSRAVAVARTRPPLGRFARTHERCVPLVHENADERLGAQLACALWRGTRIGTGARAPVLAGPLSGARG